MRLNINKKIAAVVICSSLALGLILTVANEYRVTNVERVDQQEVEPTIEKEIEGAIVEDEKSIVIAPTEKPLINKPIFNRPIINVPTLEVPPTVVPPVVVVPPVEKPKPIIPPVEKPSTEIVPPVVVPPVVVPPVEVPPTVVPSEKFLADVEQRIFELVNVERNKVGAPSLSYNYTMEKYARMKSQDMGDRGYFDHVNPEGELITQQMKYDGIFYSAWAENIAWVSKGSNDVASQIMNNWITSQGHRKNILSTNYTSIGVGVYVSGNRVYATQEFFR